MKKYLISFLLLIFTPFIVNADNELVVKNIVPNYDTSQRVVVNTPEGEENFNLTLTGREQEITYYATIENTSDTNIKINNITINNPNLDFLDYSYDNLKVDNIIEANSTRIMSFTIKTTDYGTEGDVDNFVLQLDYNETNLTTNDNGKNNGTDLNNNDNNNNQENNDTNNKESNVKNPNTTAGKIILVLFIMSGLTLIITIKTKKKKFLIITLIALASATISYTNALEEPENKILTITGVINYDQMPEKTYTIEIDPNGGTFDGVDVAYKAVVLYNTKIDLSDISREYYDFKNWTYNEEIQYMEDEVNVIEDITLKAEWKEHPTYTLTIDANGGIYEEESTKEIYLHEGETYNLKDPTYQDYLFVAWNELDGKDYLKEDVVTMGKEDVTVTAEWIKEENVVAKIPESGRYYESVQRALVEAKNNQTIMVLKDVDESFTNEKKVTLDLNKHKITGRLVNTGDITIDNGTIENTNGIAISNTGTLTLGVNDKNEEGKPNVIQDSVAIIGTTEGIEQYGTFFFYDGYIEGDVTINGSVHATPVDYVTFVDHDGEKDCQKAYLISQNNIDRAVAKTITNGEIYYFNLQDAINTAKYSKFDIYAVRDFEAAYKLTIPKDTTIVFDISGYNVTTGSNIINNGTWNIRDTADTKGKIIPAMTLENNGTLNLTDATIATKDKINTITNNGTINTVNSNVSATSGYALYNNNGTINSDDKSYFNANNYAFYNNSSTTATLTSGNYAGIYNNKNLIIDGANVTIKRTSTLTGIYNTGNLTINSGIINVETEANSSTYAYGIYNTGILEMNGGTISASHTCTGTYDCSTYKTYAYDVYCDKNGTTKSTIKNATLTSTGTGIYHSYGDVVVENSKITTNSNGIYSDYRNNIYLTNTDITSQSNAVYVNSSSTSRTLKVIGGTLTANNMGIYSDGYEWSSTSYAPTTVIIGDKDNKVTINAKGNGIYLNTANKVTITNAEITSSGSNGIYMNSTTNTLTLGENDLNVSQESPLITGVTYGININAGSFNFYDGIVKGRTNAVRGNITAIPSATVVNSNYEEIDNYEYETKFIVSQENFLEVDGVEYNSFDLAIRDIEETGTVKVIADAPVGATVTIPEGKDITIDLNGHILNTTQKIVNNGTLTVKDSSSELTGKIYNNRTNIFYNTAKMTIENGTYDSATDQYIINNSGVNAILIINNSNLKNSFSRGTYGIYNSAGNIEINDSKIEVKSTGSEVYGIYNNGYIKLKNTNITADSAASNSSNVFSIYNILTLEVDGGTITASRTCEATNCTNYKTYAYDVYCDKNGTTKSTIKNATLTSTGTGIYHSYGDVVVENSKITTNSNGIYSDYRNNIYLTNTDITSQSNAVYVNSSSTSRTLKVIGGTLTANNMGIYSDGYEWSSTSYAPTTVIIGDKDNKVTINAKGNGIYLNTANKVTITNAEITSSGSNGIYMNSTTNTLTLGENNLTVDKANPKIVGATYGVNVNAGTLNFYDGIVKGKTSAYRGAVTIVPTGMKVAKGSEIIDDYLYDTAYISEVSEIFMNKTTEKKYKELSDAISEANTGEKILFLDDVQIYENITVPNEKDITIDLNGYNLSLGAHVLTNNGSLTMTNSSETKSTITKAGENSSFVNNSNLTITNLDLNQSSGYYLVTSNSSAKTNVTDVKITSVYGFNTSGYLYLDNVNLTASNTAINNTGYLNIDESTISGTTYAIYDSGTKESTIKNTDLTSSNTTLYNYNLSSYNLEEVNITGYINNNNTLGKITYNVGTIKGTLTNKGTMNMTSITITGGTSYWSTFNLVYNSNTMTITDSTFTATRSDNYYYELRTIYNTSNLEINNSTITATNSTTSGKDITLYNDGGTIFVSKSNIIGNNADTIYGIYNTNGSSKAVVESGSVKVTNANYSYGIYGVNGVITLGVKTETTDPTYGTSRTTVSTTDPEITAIGTKSGIGVKKDNGYLNYYDGIITGSSSAKPDITSEVEYNYEVIFYTNPDTNYQYCILEYMK